MKRILDPMILVQHLSSKHLIDGRLVPSVDRAVFDVENPATREIIGQAARGNERDVDRAVQAAVKAQTHWKSLAARERGRLIAECGAKLSQHVEELGRLTALETGKAIRTESRVEASVLADVFVYYGGLGSELKGETSPFKPNVMTWTVREPLGVVGAIIPWNAPLLLMALKVAPALVAGNTVVLKTAEEAPFGALFVAEIMQEILPPGVLNVLSGYGPECGAPLVKHPKIAKVTFTGSVETGREIYKNAAEKIIPVTLELGGKSPMIVLEDADLDEAVQGAMIGMRFTRQGQSCTAASRIYVHQKLFDAFVQKLCKAIDALKMGDPLDELTDMGTIISQKQMERVQHYIALGEKTPGAEVRRCGQWPKDPKFAKGLFIQPAIFLHLPHHSPVVQEEIFGPVTAIFAFKDWEQVLQWANDSHYGLAATLWTRDLNRALEGAHRLEAGFVQVNQNLVVQPMLSYGGVKFSGLGKEASLEAMLEHFTHKKTIMIRFDQKK